MATTPLARKWAVTEPAGPVGASVDTRRMGDDRGGRVFTIDVKKELASLYGGKAGEFRTVDVPPMRYVMADGSGDPNTSAAYAAVVAALMTVSWAVRGLSKERGGTVHTVAPLEGLWSSPDPGAFVAGDKASWEWTMMVAQPAWVTAELFDAARVKARMKVGDSVDELRLETLSEGVCLQALHIGSYDDEAPLLHRLHAELIPQSGLTFNGKHHEIYLSDARKTEPAKLKTILRQPVRPIA